MEDGRWQRRADYFYHKGISPSFDVEIIHPHTAPILVSAAAVGPRASSHAVIFAEPAWLVGEVQSLPRRLEAFHLSVQRLLSRPRICVDFQIVGSVQ